MQYNDDTRKRSQYQKQERNKRDTRQDENYLNLFTSYINIPGIDGDVKWSAFIAGIIIAIDFSVII